MNQSVQFKKKTLAAAIAFAFSGGIAGVATAQSADGADSEKNVVVVKRHTAGMANPLLIAARQSALI